MTTLTVHVVGAANQEDVLDWLALSGANVTVRMFNGDQFTGQLCDSIVHEDGEGTLFIETGVIAQTPVNLRSIHSLYVNQEV